MASVHYFFGINNVNTKKFLKKIPTTQLLDMHKVQQLCIKTIYIGPFYIQPQDEQPAVS